MKEKKSILTAIAGLSTLADASILYWYSTVTPNSAVRTAAFVVAPFAVVCGGIIGRGHLESGINAVGERFRKGKKTIERIIFERRNFDRST